MVLLVQNEGLFLGIICSMGPNDDRCTIGSCTAFVNCGGGAIPCICCCCGKKCNRFFCSFVAATGASACCNPLGPDSFGFVFGGVGSFASVFASRFLRLWTKAATTKIKAPAGVQYSMP